jgi:hypothetical protein
MGSPGSRRVASGLFQAQVPGAAVQPGGEARGGRGVGQGAVAVIRLSYAGAL